MKIFSRTKKFNNNEMIFVRLILEFSPWHLSNKILVNRVPSIWLTSFTITTLLEAKDQVELGRMGLNIDTRDIELSINWLISKQSEDGSFQVRKA